MTLDISSSDGPPRSIRSLFQGSTQFRHWRFSQQQLVQVRTSMNHDAVNAIKNIRKVALGSSDIPFLTSDEEQLLVRLYLTKISQLCGLFRFPEEVEATAQTYLKRFYIKNTVMDWHPKNVMLTALFLATKTTNHPISLEIYTNRIPKTTPSDVLDLEFLVAQSLGFEFAVWHAHRALWGIFLDLQTLGNVLLGNIEEAYDKALPHVRTSRLTDAEFMYSPSQIALACLSIVSPDLALQWAIAKQNPPIETVVQDIKAMIQRDGVVPELDAVRVVDRRLKICTNPERVPGSKEYLAKKAEEDARAEEQRARKAEDVRNAVDDDDPFVAFGSTLRHRGMDLDDDD